MFSFQGHNAVVCIQYGTISSVDKRFTALNDLRQFMERRQRIEAPTYCHLSPYSCSKDNEKFQHVPRHRFSPQLGVIG
jgi:hypothetical protein